MFRTVPLSIIRSLFTVHSAEVYVIQVCRQLSSRANLALLESCLQPVWHIPLLSVQWINSWLWTEELSETCRFSCQNKFVKLVHLVDFIIKKFGTMHGHMNVKFVWSSVGGTHVETWCGYGLHTEALVYTMGCMKYILNLQTLR